MDGLRRNQWTDFIGIGGRNGPDYAIIHSLCSFNCDIDQLRVSDAISKPILFRPEDDVFDLLKELEDSYSALIVDREDYLVGIVTAFDTTEYFRERSEYNMIIEDIETAIREHIASAHVDHDGELNTEKLQDTIVSVLPGAREENRGRFIHCLKYYLDSINDSPVDIDEVTAEETLTRLFGNDIEKDFEKLSLYEYSKLLLDEIVWDHSLSQSGMKSEIMRGLLDDVRETRNSLFHFRGQLTPSESQRLRHCADWFAYHQPPEVIEVPILTEQEIAAVEELSVVEGAQKDDSFEDDQLTINLSDDDYEPSESRYAPLSDWLQSYSKPDRKLKLSFAHIEDIINDKLPASAFKHRAWWANDATSHSQSKQWLDAGWRVASVSFSSDHVTFARIKERDQKHIEFYSRLLKDLEKVNEFPLKETSPSGANWLVVARFPEKGKQSAFMALSFLRKERFRVELYIDTGDREKNKSIFDVLFGIRSEIEKNYGGELKWERLENRRASRVGAYHPGNISLDDASLDELKSWAIDALIRLYHAVEKPILKTIEAHR